MEELLIAEPGKITRRTGGQPGEPAAASPQARPAVTPGAVTGARSRPPDGRADPGQHPHRQLPGLPAWGASYGSQSYCRACYNFTRRYDRGECARCRRGIAVKKGHCRLCWLQAGIAAAGRRRITPEDFSPAGYRQLSLAGMSRLGGTVPAPGGTAAGPPPPAGPEAWTQLELRAPSLEAADGWRYSLWVTNRSPATKGWLGQNAYIDAAHRVHARVEDAVRTGKQAGLHHFPSFDYQVNAAWLTAAMTRQILLAWLKLLGLDGDLARAEPKTLRVLRAAARWAAAPPENPGILAVSRSGHGCLAAHQRAPARPLSSANRPCYPGRRLAGLVEPRPPGSPAGPASYPDAKITAQTGQLALSASH